MNRLSSLFLTIAALLAALAANAQHVDVTPRRIEVGFNKTVHILFPSPVTYIDIGSMDIIAGKAAGAENVVRVKAASETFRKKRTSRSSPRTEATTPSMHAMPRTRRSQRMR